MIARVAPSGGDDTAALRAALAALAPGDVLELAGDYQVTGGDQWVAALEPTAAGVTIRAAGSATIRAIGPTYALLLARAAAAGLRVEGVALDGGGHTIACVRADGAATLAGCALRGFDRAYGLLALDAAGLVVEGCAFAGTPGAASHAVLLYGASRDVAIRYCDLAGVYDGVVVAAPTPGTARGITIERCTIDLAWQAIPPRRGPNGAPVAGVPDAWRDDGLDAAAAFAGVVIPPYTTVRAVAPDGTRLALGAVASHTDGAIKTIWARWHDRYGRTVTGAELMAAGARYEVCGDHPNYAIHAEAGASDVRVLDCTVQGSLSDAISVHGSGCVVAGNSIWTPQDMGITANGPGAIVHGNYVYGAGASGIACASPTASIAGNVVSGWQCVNPTDAYGAGIVVAGGARVEVRGNTVDGGGHAAARYGITWAGAADVHGNTLTACAVAPLQGWGPDAEGAVVYDNHADPAVLYR